MPFAVVREDYFDGNQNLNRGHRGNHDTDETLAEILRKFRTARVAVSAAGDAAVAFSEDMGSVNYTVSLSWEDVSSGANDVVVRVKATTIAVGGFTATIAGTTPNGILHVTAIED